MTGGSDHNYAAAMQALGAVVRQIRTAQGRSQEQIALEAGVAVDTYRAIELGDRGSPKLETLLRVLEALGVEPPTFQSDAPHWA